MSIRLLVLPLLLFVPACLDDGVTPVEPEPSGPPPRVPTDPPTRPTPELPEEEGLVPYGGVCEDDGACESGLCLDGLEEDVGTCSRACDLDDDSWCNDVAAWCRPVDTIGTLACDGALPVELGDDDTDSGTLLAGDVRARHLDVGDADLYRLDYGDPSDGVQVSFRPMSGVLPRLTIYDAFGAEVDNVRFAGLGGILTANYDPPSGRPYGWVLVENLGDDPAGYTIGLFHREPPQ